MLASYLPATRVHLDHLETRFAQQPRAPWNTLNKGPALTDGPTIPGGNKTVQNLSHSGWASTEKEYPQCNTSWGNLFHVIRDYAEGKSTELPPSGRSS